MPDLRIFRPSQTLLAVVAFVLAALFSALIAWGAAVVIESRSAAAVTSRLMTEGYTWASVGANGLQLHLTGTAPNEAARFRAVNLAGSIVDSTRLRDGLAVTPARTVEAPRFSIEILRSDDGIQLIGLLPEGEAEARLTTAAQALLPRADLAEVELAEMLETAAYPAPEGWEAALNYGLAALNLLPLSKISISADRVGITAIAVSEDEKRNLEAELARTKPEGLAVAINISAPRPVLTPFTLRFVLDDAGARFDACSADTEKARNRILTVAAAAGVAGKISCTIGLGVPSPSWAEAAETGIKAVRALGHGTLTFSDADVTLLAGEDVPQATFDLVVGELRNTLPDVFSLNATLPKKVDVAQGPAEFTATLAPDSGRIELRGRLTDERLQAAVDSFAKARFGAVQVHVATRLDPELPDGWPVRVLAGLDALGLLESGSLLVRADTVEVSGVTGSLAARARISQLLSARLGQGQTFKVDVRYDEALDPMAALPTPAECASGVTAVLSRQKITFTPASAELDSAAAVMDALAAALKDCGSIRMEIAGHTDAQGSEEGNRALSQARAEAVVLALQGRGVDVAGLAAFGYGEARPIADNGDEAGREANRRIEITLIEVAGSPAAPQPDGNAALPEAAKGAALPEATEGAALPEAAEGAALPGDDSPSVAPAEMTQRPKPRPEKQG